jgi:hypothetical protein
MIRFSAEAHVAKNNTRSITDLKTGTECQKKCSSQKISCQQKLRGPETVENFSFQNILVYSHSRYRA